MLRGVYFLQIPSFIFQRMQKPVSKFFSKFFHHFSLLKKHAEKYMQCGENDAFLKLGTAIAYK